MTIGFRLRGSGALAAPGGSSTSFGRLVRRAALGAVDRVLLWQERASQRRALASLNDHMLDDIGISHADALRETDKPFWRA